MLPPQAAVNQSTDSSPPKSSSAGPAGWLTLLLLLATGATLRFLFLARKPFWFDECFSVEVARIDWRNFLHLLWWREANMSLYYVLLRFWLHFGQSQFFIRSLSVVTAVAAVPAIYWLASLLYDRRVGLMAAALLTFNAYHVRYAQEARSYALFVLLATLSTGFLVASLRQPEHRNRIGYTLASILGVYAHLYTLLLVVVHWLALRLLPAQSAEEHPAARTDMGRAWITIGAAVLPLIIFVAKTGAGPIRWIQRPGLHDVLEFYEHLAGGGTWSLPAVYAAACIAAVVPIGKRLFLPADSWETWRCQLLLVWLMFPVGLTVLLSFARPVFLARYMIFCLPALLTLVAAGLARLHNGWLLTPMLTGILLLSSQGVAYIYGHDFDNERDGSEAASDYVLDHVQPGDGVLFHIAETRVPYEFFRSLRAGENSASPNFTTPLGPEILFPRHGVGLDYRDFTGKPTADFLHTVAPSYRRVWVVLMNNGPPANPDPTTVILSRVLAESFPRLQQWYVPKVEVRLYSK